MERLTSWRMSRFFCEPRALAGMLLAVGARLSRRVLGAVGPGGLGIEFVYLVDNDDRTLINA